MPKLKRRWRKILLSLIILLAPWQQLNAAVKQFTDINGTIHINNLEKDNVKSQNENYNTAAQHKSSEVVNPTEPTPSNIFPKPGRANTLSSKPNFQAPTPE